MRSVPKRRKRSLLASNSGSGKFRPTNLDQFSDKIVEETKEVWAPYYGRALTDHEAREILCGVNDLHYLLKMVNAESSERSASSSCEVSSRGKNRPREGGGRDR
jgi:phosphoribosyl-ATP pyrophosphohydrolase